MQIVPNGIINRIGLVDLFQQFWSVKFVQLAFGSSLMFLPADALLLGPRSNSGSIYLTRTIWRICITTPTSIFQTPSIIKFRPVLFPETNLFQ
jgi:hypothetical protein